jgi:hypothetical protein
MAYNKYAQIDELKRWVGWREGPNNQNPFSVWMGYGTPFLPWCGAFANYCAVEKGGFHWDARAQFGYKGDGYVPGSVATAKRMGLWRSKYTKARPGWQAIYDWSGSGGDHIETVIEDKRSIFNWFGDILLIGGNTGNMVAYRLRNNSGLMGFIALDEAGQNASGTPSSPIISPDLKGLQVLKTDKMDAVAVGSGSYVLQADGGVFAYGVPFYGSIPGAKISLVMGTNHAMSILTTPTKKGYWVLTWDGGVFSFGDAKYYGNFLASAKTGKGAVELLSTTDGKYRAVMANGTVSLPKF